MKSPLILILLFSLAFECFSSPINPPDAQNLGISLASQILNQISTVELSCDPSFGEKNLEYMKSTLQIPPAPRLLPSQPRMVNLQNIADGLELHRRLLQDIKENLKCSGDVTLLLANIHDLMQEVERLAGVSPSHTQASSFSLSELPGDDEYRLQVALHLILKQLRQFAQGTTRTLRKNTGV